jgi:NAD(P)-dependent dehydrogenase (short-subunit alcohol dehydrogenase family)
MKTLKQLMSMEGRNALITGGGGHIGKAMAEALAELGCGLVLVDCRQEDLEDFAQGIRDTWMVPVWTQVVDLEDMVARQTLAATVAEQCGCLDVLINNAAFVGDSKIAGWVVPFEEQSIETWRRVQEVNLTSVFHLSQLLAPLLKASRKGSILNVGSIYGVVGPDLGIYAGTSMNNPAAYAASKGGMVQLTRWLATVLAPDVRVNCISPGGVLRNQPEAFVERYIGKTPMARMATEEDFKGVVAYFASDMSAYVTGENLMVDGGWTAW